MTVSPFSATWRPDVVEELAALAAGLSGKQPSSAILTALAALNATPGILVKAGASTFAKRSLAGTTNEIVVSNGDGAAGNPTLSLSGSIDAAKAFRRGNILGAVSQSSGVPTGALMERGSNANGEYVRWADGTQICWLTRQWPAQAISTSASIAITFPASFASSSAYSPSVTPKTEVGGGAQSAIGLLINNGLFWGSQTTGSVVLGSFSYRSAIAEPIDLYIQFVGRWF